VFTWMKKNMQHICV